MTSETVWRDLIVGYRKKHALTQADAASRLNVSQQTISRWESGKQEPDTAAQAILREQLGMVAMTMRDNWIKRVNLSAGREYLFEQGWRLIALSAPAGQDERLLGPSALGQPLADQHAYAPLVSLLSGSGLFAGDAALARVKLAFRGGAQNEGRILDFWPVLTGTDEILVHALAYPFTATASATDPNPIQILDASIVARDAFGHKTA